MPLSPDAFKYYTFRQEGTDTISGIPVYNIRFTPRQWSQKLLSGNLYVTDELWTIDRIEIQGHSSFSEFNLSIRFNRDEKHFILPEEADLQVCYHALGNRIESDIHAAFRYKSISWVEEDHESRNYTRSIKPNTIRSPPTHSPLPKTALIGTAGETSRSLPTRKPCTPPERTW